MSKMGMISLRLSNGKKVDIKTNTSKNDILPNSEEPQVIQQSVVNIYGGVNSIAPNANTAVQNINSEEK